MRYNQNGKLDNSFGLNGIASVNAENSEEARSLAMQSDGKLIAAGSSAKGSGENFALIRLNVDGTADNSFGASGIVETPIGKISYSSFVLIQDDEKIIVVGTSISDNQGDYNFTLARYNGMK